MSDPIPFSFTQQLKLPDGSLGPPITLWQREDVPFMRHLLAQGAEFDTFLVDPPWLYSGGKNNTKRGLAGFHYEGIPDLDIARSLAYSAGLAKPDSYLIFWTTFPKLAEWFKAQFSLDKLGWTYITGGVWGKLGNLGVGYHLRGDAELILIYKHGQPQVQVDNQSDLWLDPVDPSLLWTAQRGKHSVKPVPILRDLLSAFTPAGGSVLELYAGEQASGALAARSLGLSYMGCEKDPIRFASSVSTLQLPALFDVYPAPLTRSQLEQMLLPMEVPDATDVPGAGPVSPGHAPEQPNGRGPGHLSE